MQVLRCGVVASYQQHCGNYMKTPPNSHSFGSVLHHVHSRCADGAVVPIVPCEPWTMAERPAVSSALVVLSYEKTQTDRITICRDVQAQTADSSICPQRHRSFRPSPAVRRWRQSLDRLFRNYPLNDTFGAGMDADPARATARAMSTLNVQRRQRLLTHGRSAKTPSPVQIRGLQPSSDVPPTIRTRM
jgi:hypothetical protein